MAGRKDDIVRVFIPDTHGSHIDPKAKAAFLADLKRLAPDQVVYLGDHVDCGGIFSTHSRTYTNEMCESYEEDIAATVELLDDVTRAVPQARAHYLEGNHEVRVSRWAAANFQNRKDADAFLHRQGPAALLELKRRGIRYVSRTDFVDGCSIPGTIRLRQGHTDVYATHGLSAAANAAAVHLSKFGANVVFGHVHRALSVHGRSVDKGLYGAWCPGTLALLQPLYLHTNVSQWALGYAIQFVARSGHFVHFQVPIVKGESMLGQVTKALR